MLEVPIWRVTYLMNKWLLIKDGFNNGFYNMAADEELLSFNQPVLRIYGFKPYCLSLGYFMNANEDIDFDFCQNNNIDVTRRITGGKAVLHANELTYCVVVPLGSFSKSIMGVYEKISNALKNIFEKIGIEVENSTDYKRLDKNAICFAEKSKYEITSKGKKIIGFAQKKYSDKILHHGSIPFSIDFKILSGCFKGNKVENEAFIRERVTSINNELPNNIDYKEFSEFFIKGFEETLDIDFTEYKYTPIQKENILKKARSKYVLPCWVKNKIK